MQQEGHADRASYDPESISVQTEFFRTEVTPTKTRTKMIFRPKNVSGKSLGAKSPHTLFPLLSGMLSMDTEGCGPIFSESGWHVIFN